MLPTCSIRDELDQKIQEVNEEYAIKKYEGPKAEREIQRRIDRLISQKLAHCGKHGCLREVQQAQMSTVDADALG